MKKQLSPWVSSSFGNLDFSVAGSSAEMSQLRVASVSEVPGLGSRDFEV